MFLTQSFYVFEPLDVGHFFIHLTPSHSTPATPHRGSAASVRSHGNLDRHLQAHHVLSESRPSPACRTGNGEALESRASSCIAIFVSRWSDAGSILCR